MVLCFHGYLHPGQCGIIHTESPGFSIGALSFDRLYCGGDRIILFCLKSLPAVYLIMEEIGK